jgi:hypothetical protein
MPLMFYSKSLESLVVYDMIEDPTLTVPMKLTSMGVLYVKGQFIEYTRSYYYPNPVPAPVGTMSFDDFNSYANLALLNGLNSGSNEWDNTTELAAYFAREAYIGIKEWDDFNSYASGSLLSASLAGSGTGSWSGSYDYYGRVPRIGIRVLDTFESYVTESSVNGLVGGTTNNQGIPWIDPWGGRSVWYGIQALDTFATYASGSNVSGSNDQQDSRYQNFSGPWDGRTVVTP